ncbi:MAG TPA: hypothetical protein VFI15_12340 [Candidatus Limnocylindrales bacterium]|nr:hypothetical protein [Candidatus Limnocylindrales bacterium]
MVRNGTWPRAAAIVLGALILAFAVAVTLPPNVVYPDYCTTTANSGTFCISYDPALGRYENPPADVPADVSAFATSTARPDQIRAVIGAAVFAALVALGWVAGRIRRRAHVTLRGAD